MVEDKLYKSFVDAIWYNMGEEWIKYLLNLPVKEFPNIDYRQIVHPEEIESGTDANQVWSMLVLMFGSYGSSPRFGWIEDVDGYKKFLTNIYEELTKEEDF